MAGCASPTAVSPFESKEAQSSAEKSSPGTPPPSDHGTPPAAALTTQDLWLVSPEDLLQGNTQTGTHYAVHAEFNAAKISPDGKRALLFVTDKSQMRTTYPTWIDVLDLATQKQRRLTPQSDWWTANWLPDGRVVLIGARVWLSDTAAETLQDLGEAGGTVGAAFDGRQQVAWTARHQIPGHDLTNEYQVHMLNLTTGVLTEFPDIYHTRVDPHAGAPLVFSPDGGRLAYLDHADGKAYLVILSVASGGQTRITVDASADITFWDRHGLWVRHRSGDAWIIGRLDEQGREVERIPDTWLVVSPDGRRSSTSRYTEQMKSQPGLVDLRTGEVAWFNVVGYYPCGWTPTGELVLIESPQ